MTLRAATGSLLTEGQGARHPVSVGFSAQAVFLWWSRVAENSAGPTNQGGMGVAAAGSEQASVCWAAVGDELAWWSSDGALIGYRRPGAAEPELNGGVSWTGDGFTLDCSRSGEGRWHVRYLALGGEDSVRAAVRRFEIDRSGRITRRGLGFEPSLLLFLAGAGGQAMTPVSGLMHGIGAATGPDSQVAAALTAWAGAGRAAVRGSEREGAVVALPDPLGLQRPSVFAQVVSMEGDGFTLETTLEDTEPPLPVACLALTGGHYRLGVTTSGTANRHRKDTRTPGLRPEALLAFSWGSDPTAAPREYGRLCVGAASRTGETGCISWALRGRPAWPLRPSARPSPDNFLEVIDTTSDQLHAQATLDRMLPEGFSLDWRLADEHHREFAYIGFGAGLRPTLRDRVASRMRRPALSSLTARGASSVRHSWRSVAKLVSWRRRVGSFD